MADSSVTDAEIVLLEELARRRVKFMVIGMSAAVIQGVDVEHVLTNLELTPTERLSRSLSRGRLKRNRR